MLPSMRYRLMCALVLVLVAQNVSAAPEDPAAPQTLTVRIALTASLDTPAVAEVELRSAVDVQRVPVHVPGEARVALPAGVVYVRVISDSLWSGMRAYNVQRDGEMLTLPVYAAGVITGTAKPDDGTRALHGVTAIFAAHDGRAPWAASTTTPCDVSALRWSCTVPADTLDVRLRVPGFVSAYFLSAHVERGSRKDVGDIELRRGSSVVGRVIVDDAPRAREGLRRPAVTIEPAPGASGRNPRMRGDSVPADERGFFHFDDVALGLYQVAVSLPGYALSRASVQVVEGRESELLAPLRLERAKTLQLYMDPSRDSHGNVWLVKVLTPRTESFWDTVTQSAANNHGEWAWHGPRGDYRLEVRAADGRLWKTASVTLDREPTVVNIHVTPQQLHGRVYLGDRPLSASLAFGGRGGPEAESSADGTFTADAPSSPDGTWHVLVNSEEAGVHREVVAHAADDGTLEIHLPATRIAGVVSDQEGNGVAGAVVTVTSDATAAPSWSQVHSAPGGVFEVAGLDAREYSVSAEAAAGQSDVVTATLSERDSEKRIELVLRPHRLLHGTVTSAAGPVGGAEIYIVPLQGYATNRLRYTTQAGEFNAVLPPATESFDVSVSAPGFARTFLRTRYRPDSTLNLQVHQQGGLLTVDIPRTYRSPSTYWTYLVRGEARVMLGTLQRWGVEQTAAPDRAILDVPQIEPGEYRLCAVPAGGVENAGPLDPKHCVSGLLAPYGRLVLRLD
jgi:hypothetical protein